MTRVARKVAFDFQSNTPGDFAMHEKKQIYTYDKKMCVFLVFDDMFCTCFNEKVKIPKNKTKQYFCGTQTMNSFLYLLHPPEINQK